MKTVRVGQMPGQISEFAVEVGTSIASLIELAGLSAAGYDVKVDGNTVTNASAATVSASTNLVILAKQVKGNAPTTVRVGQMPGQISEFAVDDSTSLSDLIATGGLNATGYDVKVDGNTATDLSRPVGAAKLVILAKQVKGNK